jgi:hypothetical protein
MANRRIVLNSLVALIAVVLTGGMASVAVIGGLPSEPPSGRGDTVLAAQASARIDAGAVTPTLTALDTAAAPVSAASPVPAVTAPPLPGTPRPAAPLTPPPTWGPGGHLPVPPPPPVPPTLPPIVPVADPSSWSLVENGITITASIDPARPRVGDTVTISYATAAEGDFCCWSRLFVDGSVVDEHLFPPGDECPTASEGSWTTTVVVTSPGPFTFQVQGNSWPNLCAGPPTYFNANLYATFEVLPAA